MPRILAKIVNLAAKTTETLTGKTWIDHDSNARYGADVIAHLEDANGLLPGEGGYVGPTVQVPLLKIVTDDIISTDLTANAYTFNDGDVDAVAVKNDGTSDLTITIDTLLFTIKPGESRILELAPFDTVTFSAGAIFRLNGLRRS